MRYVGVGFLCDGDLAACTEEAMHGWGLALSVNRRGMC